jgi:GPI mannosyltransferase 3
MKFLKLYLWPIVILVITAYFSEGFYHPDEHFQLLELAHLKISGHGDFSLFNWDFHSKIRSWFQPFLYTLILWPLKAIGTGPFISAFILRLLHGALGLYALKEVIQYFEFKNFKVHRVLNFAFLVWFVPFILVRPSSESLSLCLFLLGSIQLIKKKANLTLGAGLLGMSFLARYQMGIPIAIAFIWSLKYQRKTFIQYALIAGVLLIMILLGSLIDFWGYSEWVFSPGNYLRENLINNRASEFGTSPIWSYITLPLIKGFPPFSLVLILATFYFWYKKKNDYLSWTTLSFFIIHSIIAHKELRFLNFIYILSPLFFISYLDANYEKLKPFKKNIIVKGLLSLCLISNILPFLKTSFSPAHSPIKIYRALYDLSFQELYVPQEKNAQLQLNLRYYLKRPVQTKAIALEHIGKMSSTPFHLLTSKYNQYTLAKKSNCSLQYSLYPEWIFVYNYFNWLKRSSVWAIWKCSNTKG